MVASYKRASKYTVAMLAIPLIVLGLFGIQSLTRTIPNLVTTHALRGYITAEWSEGGGQEMVAFGSSGSRVTYGVVVCNSASSSIELLSVQPTEKIGTGFRFLYAELMRTPSQEAFISIAGEPSKVYPHHASLGRLPTSMSPNCLKDGTAWSNERVITHLTFTFEKTSEDGGGWREVLVRYRAKNGPVETFHTNYDMAVCGKSTQPCPLET
jgi:hypothetical protein